MTTAMTTACFTGLVRAAGMLLTVIILAEFIYFLLFSDQLKEAEENKLSHSDRFKFLFSDAFHAKENNVCNPYRFKNQSKLSAKALSFIFFIQPGVDRFATCECKNHSSSGKNYSANSFFNSENNPFSIHPVNNHSINVQRNDVTGKLFTNGTLQNPTTCL